MLRRVGKPAHHEVLFQFREPIARSRLQQRHMRVDGEGLKLLALGKEAFDRGGAGRAHKLLRDRLANS
jgi:hypothetical protein